MAKKASPLVRLLVPVIGLVVCIGVAWAVFTNSANQRIPTPGTTAGTPAAANQPAATPPAVNTPSAQPAAAPVQAPAAPPANADAPATTTPATTPATTPTPAPATTPPASAQPAVSPGTLRAQVFKDDPLAASFASLGSIDGVGDSKAQIDFADIGAGISKLTLAEHYTTVDKTEKVALQNEAAQGDMKLTPFAALGLQVVDPTTNTTQFVTLARGSRGGPVWRQVAPGRAGEFEAIILNDKDQKVLRITRTYRVKPGLYDFEVIQKIENLSQSPITARWFQFGPSDLPNEGIGYGGDKRRLRFGHLLDPALDPTRQVVVSSDYLIPHQTALGSRDNSGVFKEPSPSWPMSPDDLRIYQRPLWPDAKADERRLDLVWAGMINRYFGIAVHPVVDPADPKADLQLHAFNNIGRYVFDRGPGQEVLALRSLSPVLTLAPGSTTDLSFGVYAGPLAKHVINADAVAKRVGLDEMIVYSFGGFCGPCTFEFFTHGLLALLTFLRNHVFFDWSLSIIFLVVIVRTVLHPVTKWTQIRMQRFGKQMQGMAPKQKKIQERFGTDKARMQQEMAKLWREEGVSPLGFLGCLPMFLVMPVWIALSAMLTFAQELRQQPAFYGVFQNLTQGKWHFLADLSEPDSFYPLATPFNIPLLSSLMGPISAFNVVPIILGFVFFAHQKYLTPPSATTMTPEQEMQMKITKWMSVILFPLMMYNAPSGLALYFTANSAFAIFENQWIRKHIDKHDLLNPETFKKKKPSGVPSSGFMARLQAAAEAKMRESEAKKKALDRNKKR